MSRKIKIISALVLTAVLLASTAGFALADGTTVSASYAGNGRIHISTNNFSYSDPTDELWFAVWTAENGQDDLDWYRADASFNCEVDMAAHGNYKGVYYIHAYTYDTNDVPTFVAGTEFVFKGETAVYAQAADSSNRRFDLVVENYDLPSGCDLWAAVWSDENGQDDLDWYLMEEAADGNYHYTADADRHSGAGHYEAHVYCITRSDDYIFVGATGFTAAEKQQVAAPQPQNPAAVNVSFENHSNKKGTCDIIISNVPANAGYTSVRAAVWSQGDQGDINWYDCANAGNGRWTVQMDLKNHRGNLGSYWVHIYAFTADGRGSCLTGSTVTFADPALEPDPVTDSVEMTAGSEKFYITSTTPKTSVRKLRFAVWSQDRGQDDLVWYDVAFDTASSSGTLELLKNQLPEKGVYICHVYAELKNGRTEFVAATEFTAQLAEEPMNVKVSADTAGGFVISAAGLESGFDVKKAEFAVWSEADGQDDLIWYNAERMADGTYRVSSSASKHKGSEGKYYCHVYVTTKAGAYEFACGTEFDVEEAGGEMTLSISEGIDERYYTITLSHVPSASRYSKIRFAVWSQKDGQDDIIWYTASQQGNRYVLDLDVKNHGSSGTYYIHAYGVNANGSYDFLKESTDLVVESYAQGRISVANMDVFNGLFDVVVRPESSSIPVEGVKVYVWCADDKSDKGGYTAYPQSDGSFRAYVNIENHGFHSGLYKFEAYAVLANGCECEMALGRQYFSMGSSIVVSGTEGTNVRRVAYKNSSVSELSAAVWTLDRGQDDLVWYQGTPDGQGGFYFDVAGRNHSGDGTYLVHLYSGDDFLESTQFTMISYVERGITMGMDESIGYSQTRRYLNPDADCSSFVFYALVHSGYTGLGSSPFYTGTMVNVMKNAGWQVLPFTSMDDLQPGDILWYRRTDIQGTHGHTEIYIGNGRMVGAHGDDGSIFESIGGDQTGKEVCEVAFHNPGWMTVLRYLQL